MSEPRVHPQYGWVIEDDDDIPSNRSTAPNFFAVTDARLSRRSLLKGGAATVALAGTGTPLAARPAHAASPSTLTFEELARGRDEQLHVAPGYDHQVLIRWGDKVLADAPDWDSQNQTAEAQSRQFGFNNDFVGFLPLPAGSRESNRGLLVVNHEYTSSKHMFPGAPAAIDLTEEQANIDMMAHGLSVIAVVRQNGRWRVADSPLNRRITPMTRMAMSGPAAGSGRLVTPESPDGTRTFGTYGNCAGGVTPWGTVLTAEENVQNYFKGNPAATEEAENYERFGLPGGDNPRYAWGHFHERFDLAQRPREPLHAGWIVEIDPYDADFVPKKRTALGRCKHEGCNVTINGDGRVVAYTGDDQRFEYIYRFVSDGTYDPADRAANMDLLDRGTLSVAEFRADGRVAWHRLVHGEGPLTEENGFRSQADVVIDVRKAADLVGATPMDRPEDIEINPVTGTVFANLTNNSRRAPTEVNAANPRHTNLFGHIIEMRPPDGDHGAAEFTWDFFILAGDPRERLHGAMFHPETSEDGWFVTPDNMAFDNKGRIWLATDGGDRYGFADGCWAADCTGEGRALSRHFLRCPIGSELCGPFFTPDDRNFFGAVQHPGAAGDANFDQPATRWPDFAPGVPPRPSVIVVTRTDGGEIGS